MYHGALGTIYYSVYDCLMLQQVHKIDRFFLVDIFIVHYTFRLITLCFCCLKSAQYYVNENRRLLTNYINVTITHCNTYSSVIYCLLFSS